eukprot:1771586-Amphidinium_carterae.1
MMHAVRLVVASDSCAFSTLGACNPSMSMPLPRATAASDSPDRTMLTRELYSLSSEAIKRGKLMFTPLLRVTKSGKVKMVMTLSRALQNMLHCYAIVANPLSQPMT